LTNTNELIIDFKALTDRRTPVSLTSHSYFNLAGHAAGSKELYDHRVELQADHYTPVDASCLVTGEIVAVKGTAFDLTKETRLGDVIHNVPNAKGFDHNFVINSNHSAVKFNNVLPLVAKLWHPQSGRLLQVYSDQPGIQFYTGNNLPSDGTLVGKNKTTYSIHGGLCLETQNFPNAINQVRMPNHLIITSFLTNILILCIHN
jgi:aldose 1-epimerase